MPVVDIEMVFPATWFFEMIFREENVAFFAVISSWRVFCFVAMKMVARVINHLNIPMCSNVEVTGAARLYRAASVWTAGLGCLNEALGITVLPPICLHAPATQA